MTPRLVHLVNLDSDATHVRINLITSPSEPPLVVRLSCQRARRLAYDLLSEANEVDGGTKEEE